MPASRIAELERENARLSSALEQSNAALTELQSDYQVLKQQLEWFKRQLFGEKSEKRLDIDPEEQGNLLAALGVLGPPRQVNRFSRINLRSRPATDRARR